MNWFATVLRVVICFIILTDLTELSVEFCVDEVFEDRGGLDVRRRRKGKSSSLGMQGTRSKYLRRLKCLSLGMPQKASHLSSKSIHMFLDSFRSRDMCKSWSVFCIQFYPFYFMHHAGMRQSMVDLQNTHCTSPISFEYGFIEYFMCFTYIF